MFNKHLSIGLLDLQQFVVSILWLIWNCDNMRLFLPPEFGAHGSLSTISVPGYLLSTDFR
jgi:hypothetical protein